MVDKYQAFIKRSTTTHQQAIEQLREIVDKNLGMNDQQKAEYYKIIEIIDRDKEMIFKVINSSIENK